MGILELNTMCILENTLWMGGRRMKAVFSLSDKGVLNTERGRLQRSLWCWIKVEMSVKMPDFLTHAVMQVDQNRYRWTCVCEQKHVFPISVN